jgi:hypothetical protein
VLFLVAYYEGWAFYIIVQLCAILFSFVAIADRTQLTHV